MSHNAKGRWRTANQTRTAVIVGSAVVSILALAGCSATNHDAASGATDTDSSVAGDCGKLPEPPVTDVDGVVAGLPADVSSAYPGYTSPVVSSQWAKWKPNHSGPYKVGILWDPPINAFQQNTLKAMTSALQASGDVDVIASVSPQAPNDVPGDLQLFNQLVAKKPDLIIAEPLAPGPFVQAVDAAGKAGIPVVSAWNPTPSAYSVGVGVNNFLQAATLASSIVKDLGGKGNVLLVHGIPGVQQDNDAMAGFKAVMANCPDVKVAGEVTGNYDPAATKAATLQFLSSHPGQVDAVFQSGVMTIGIIQAFEQLGRKVPAITDLGATQGSVAYAHAHKDNYTIYGTTTADTSIGTTVATVALRVLAGDGPVLNQMVTQPGYITKDNLDDVYQDGWTVASTGDASLPDEKFMSDEQLNAFFGTK